MKLYAIYTPSHLILKEEWFIPTLQDDYGLVLQYCEQAGPQQMHAYKTPWFNQTMLRKVKLIIRAIKENWNDVFIFSDIDVQFFLPTKNILLSLIFGNDLVFQRDSSLGFLNAGFILCRSSQKTLNLWLDVEKYMLENRNKDDQDALNYFLFHRANKRLEKCYYRLVRNALSSMNKWGSVSDKIAPLLRTVKNDYGIKWRYLPKEFFSPGIMKRCIWSPGMEFPIPRNIIMHHANWTTGVKNKIAQLQYVRDVVNKKNRA